MHLLINAKLTGFHYNMIRIIVIKEVCNLYPNYESVTRAKIRFYPENIAICEILVEVSLQDMLNRATMILVKAQEVLLHSGCFYGISCYRKNYFWIFFRKG